MTIVSGLRPGIVTAKERLAVGRAKLKQRHNKGAFGVQVCAGIADLFDTIAIELFESALADLGEEGTDGLAANVALVPHGGYGRRDVAPYSDVDLMILHEPGWADRVKPLANRMLCDVADVGLDLGHSVRTPAQACQQARNDATICTSLIESRFLAGSVDLYSRFANKFQKQTSRRWSSLVLTIEKARRDERGQYGETVYLLEPNIKRSQGGLRDIQLLRWIGFARYRTSDPNGLRLSGDLSEVDYDMIRRATEYLLRLRNEMHFTAGKANDVLDRAEQLRLAELYGFHGTAGLLPVEQFMQEYFRMTNGVANVAGRFVASARRGPLLGKLLAPLLSHQFEGDYRVGPTQISANARGLGKLHGSLAEIIRLCDVANWYDKPIAHATCEAIRATVPTLPDEMTPEVATRFLALLDQPARLGPLLRTLHEMGALEKVLPDFAHARCLLQFNEYHKYTVDEHCLLAVERAASFRHDTGPLGLVYRPLKRKWLLHLALLLHDLGKGYAEDHSEIGVRIAGETARRLELADRNAETLKFLVHKHLQMSHLAFRRDTSDQQLVVRFAVEVGSPEALQMLFVLTAADLAAVGPGVLNAWKIEVLADLYRRTMQHLAGEAPPTHVEDWLARHRRETLAKICEEEDIGWFNKQLAALPATYLQATPPESVVEDLRELARLAPGEAVAHGRYLAESNTIEYRVGTYETIAPGVFHKLTGALASHGLQILSAEINTLIDGLIFDRFFVHDPDYAGEPPSDRLDAVSRSLVAALLRGDGKAPPFRRVWRPGQQRTPAALRALPTQVRVDNSTSDRYTILDIFAADRTGLLYTIARTLFELELSVSVAKIGTYLDQVVDVFYVTDQSGAKIHDEGRLSEIRARLLAAVEELERQEAERLRA